MKWWSRVTTALGFRPETPQPVRVRQKRKRPLRSARRLAAFENSQTETRILAILESGEPMTVRMVQQLMPSVTTVSQALPQMWKRGVVHRRREDGRNTYWYALSLEAFKPQPVERVFTDSERMRRDDWDRLLMQPSSKVEWE